MNEETDADSLIKNTATERELNKKGFNENEGKESIEQINSPVSTQNESEDAFSDVITAVTYLFNGSPGAATEYYGKAHEKFEKLKDSEGKRIYDFFADYSKAMEIASKGVQYIALGNLNEAKTLFQRAQFSFSQAEKELPTLLDKDFEDESQYKILQSYLSLGPIVCDSYYCLAEARDQFSHGNYPEASELFYETADNYQQMIQYMRKNEVPEPMINLYIGEYYNYLGNGYLAEGEALREQEKWDEALKRYTEVRKTWKKGAQSYMESGFSQGLAMQVYLTSEISKISELYVKRCKVDQDQKTKIQELKSQIQTLIDSIGKSGVTVNNMQDVNSIVKQNVEIIQTLETNIKKNIQNLLDELDDTSVPNKDKEHIRDRAEELIGSENKGNQFMKSAKEFTEDLKEIVNNIGDTAKPLLPFVTALSLLI